MLFVRPIRLLLSGLITCAVLAFGGYQTFTGLGGARDAQNEANANAADAGSMLRSAEFADALVALRAETGAGADALRLAVYPGYVSAETSTGSETKAKGLKIDGGGDITPFDVTLSGPGALADNVFALADVEPDVLDTIIAGISEEDPSLGLSDVTHALAGIDPVSGRADWKVYVRGGAYYTANLDGSGLRKGGTAPADATAQADDALSDARKVTDCLARATGDVAAVQACTR